MTQLKYYSYRPKQKTRAALKHDHRLLFVAFAVIVASAFIGYGLRSMHEVNAAQGSSRKGAQLMVAQTPPKLITDTNLLNAWTVALAGHQGSVDIAVYNHKTGQTTNYATTNRTFNTASIVKVSILAASLLKDQTSGASLSQEATPMIENSDNDAATDLWKAVGGTTAMNSFFQKVGTSKTTAGKGGEWGLTQTTALDQLKIMNTIAYPGSLLTTASAQAANTLLDNIESDQAWGVSAGLPDGVNVELKNGWLPDNETSDSYSGTGDWTINSIGHIHGGGQDYTIAVLTDGDPSEQSGITTIEMLATQTWNTLTREKS